MIEVRFLVVWKAEAHSVGVMEVRNEVEVRFLVGANSDSVNLECRYHRKDRQSIRRNR